MNRCPSIGDRVRYAGRLGVGPCVGVVTAIYPEYEWDESSQREGKQSPEREWRVAMKPDVLPEPWSYVGNDQFAPAVKEITRIGGDK